MNIAALTITVTTSATMLLYLAVSLILVALLVADGGARRVCLWISAAVMLVLWLMLIVS